MKTKHASNGNSLISNYLDLAQEDYIVARFLLRNGFLEHGAMLGATAVEKHLKAIIGIHGINNTDHLGGSLYKLLKKYQPELMQSMSTDVLKFFEKAYKLRYASTSSPGLAIVINQYRTLFALDQLIALIDKGLVIRNAEGIIQSPYQRCLSEKQHGLIVDNMQLNDLLASSFMSMQNKVLEFKIENDFSTLRIEYQTQGVNMLGSMMKIPDISVDKNTFVLTRG